MSLWRKLSLSSLDNGHDVCKLGEFILIHSSHDLVTCPCDGGGIYVHVNCRPHGRDDNSFDHDFGSDIDHDCDYDYADDHDHD